ncbi:hypothetical protein BJ165DRAFT_1510523 [Panaeolus papilionaceus]|nr:hypothetical protein BJ165DRAFT_1510523 [Panaeolus papilionaceus]
MNHCFNDTQIDPSLRRSLFKIVWTCATTLFACTYVAIHPNISVDESDGVVLLRRIGLMIAMGVVPELVVLWALQQRLLASSLRIIHRGGAGKWTQAHGFFMIMGGFCYYTKGGIRKTLDYDTLKRLHDEGKIQWPTVVTEPEIKDRSKADILTKTIVLIQTSWFCIQFITRLILHLDVTELEIATFAYAILNIVVYLLWLNKPFDVRSQILLRGEHDPVFPQSDVEKGPRREGSTEVPLTGDSKSQQPELTSKQYLRQRWHDLSKKNSSSEDDKIDLSDIILFPYHTFQNIFMNPFSREYTDFSGSPPTKIDLDGHVEKHPVVGWKAEVELWFLRKFRAKSDGSAPVPFSICMAIIFGGTHLIAWKFHFPSVAEMWLWRASSLALVAPAVLLMLLRIPGGAWICGIFPNIVTDILSIFSWIVGFMIVPIIYAMGRAIILFLPLIALRRLPCGAFEDINWLGIFFPHF